MSVNCQREKYFDHYVTIVTTCTQLLNYELLMETGKLFLMFGQENETKNMISIHVPEINLVMCPRYDTFHFSFI